MDQKSFIESKMQDAFMESMSYGKTHFSKYVELAKSAYADKYSKPMGVWQEHNLVRSLMNMEKDFVRLFGADTVRKCITESTTTPSDVGKFINHSFGIATAMIPDSILEKFTSVQTMDKRVGEVFYMNILKGNDKGKFNTAGTSYMDALTGPNTSANYTSEFVDIEEFADGDGSTLSFSTTLGYGPLVPGQVNINFTIIEPIVGATYYTVTDNGAGAFTADVNVASGTVDYTTKAVTIVFKSGKAPAVTTKVSSSYQYNSQLETGTVVSFTANLTNVFLTAQRRAANLKYLFDAALMLNREHGIDMEAELLEKGTSGMINEIVIDCINKIYAAAPGGTNEIIFDKTPPSTQIPYIIHRQEIIGQIADGALVIENSIRYAKANVIAGGKDFTSLCRGLPNDVFKKVDYSVNPVGAHVVGVLDNQYEVIQCLDMVSNGASVQDKFCLIAMGPDNLHTGSIFAEYIPITLLNANWTQSLDIFRGAVTYNAFKIVNSNFFLKGKIVTTTP